jgi:hypothetical protein
MIADLLLAPALLGGTVIILTIMHLIDVAIDHPRVRETIGVTIATIQAHIEETTRNRGPATSRQTTPANTGKANQ